MDGHYVPNLSIGPPVVKALRKHTDLFLDCHLMVDNPGVLLAGSPTRAPTVAPCTSSSAIRGCCSTRSARSACASGCRSSRDTPFAAVEPYLDEIDLLLVMSVHTGFGGQPFIPEVLDKVRAARAAIDERALPVEIEIDGGIKIDNAHLAVEAGVDILVSGTGIFGADDPRPRPRAIRAAGVDSGDDARGQGADRLRRRRRRHPRRRERPRRWSRRSTAAGYEVVDAPGHEPTAPTRSPTALAELADGFAGLIVTTGGTGFGPRDLTPEGTRAVHRTRGAGHRRGDPAGERRRRPRASACCRGPSPAPGAGR